MAKKENKQADIAQESFWVKPNKKAPKIKTIKHKDVKKKMAKGELPAVNKSIGESTKNYIKRLQKERMERREKIRKEIRSNYLNMILEDSKGKKELVFNIPDKALIKMNDDLDKETLPKNSLVRHILRYVFDCKIPDILTLQMREYIQRQIIPVLLLEVTARIKKRVYAKKIVN